MELILFLELNNNKQKIYVGTIYRHSNSQHRNRTLSELNHWIDFLQKDIIICGDWNSTPHEVESFLAGKVQVHCKIGKRGTRQERQSIRTVMGRETSHMQH